MQLLSRFLIVTLVASLLPSDAMLSASAGPLLVDKTPLRPGLYRQLRPHTAQVLHLGNEIVIRARPQGRGIGSVSFTINAVRALDLNTGSISGIMLDALPSTWAQTSPNQRCRLHFAATRNGFMVIQDLAFGDCGFGYGVTADGTYERVSSVNTQPLASKTGAQR